jgi:serine protease
VELTGLSSDVDLYVRAGALPTLGDYDCRPYTDGTSSETCTLPNSGATTWYIGVHGYRAGSYTIKATLIGGGGGPTVLDSGVPETGTVLQGQWTYYQIDATVSHTQLVVDLTGLSSDVDLYVRAGALPTLGDYDCRPYTSGTSAETCILSNSGATTWYIGVHGYSAGSYTIEATVDGGAIALESGVPKAGSVMISQWRYYQIDATVSHTQIVVELTGLSSDVDLYVRAGALPTLGDYDCRPYTSGTSSETCTLPNSGATTWYIGVHGYTAGGYTIEATL